MVENVKREAKENGVKNLDKIVSDEETEYTAGEHGKIELADHGKCIVLLRMWKENGELWFAKYTRNAEILKPVKAKTKLYPHYNDELEQKKKLLPRCSRSNVFKIKSGLCQPSVGCKHDISFDELLPQGHIR